MCVHVRVHVCGPLASGGVCSAQSDLPLWSLQDTQCDDWIVLLGSCCRSLQITQYRLALCARCVSDHHPPACATGENLLPLGVCSYFIWDLRNKKKTTVQVFFIDTNQMGTVSLALRIKCFGCKRTFFMSDILLVYAASLWAPVGHLCSHLTCLVLWV